MKLKDHFSRQKKQAKLGGEDFEKFLESLPDADIPDVVSNLLEENFLTRERALADKDLIKKFKAEVYDGIDADIKDYVSSMPAQYRDPILNERDTHKKIEMLDSVWKKQFEELKKNVPTDVKVNEEHLKTIRELTERVEIEKTEREKILKNQQKEIKDITDQKEKELKTYKIKTDLVGKLGQLEFAREFTESPTVKNMFFNGVIEDIMKNELDYDESGHIVVHEISNGVPKPKFYPGTNDLVTLDKLLETATAPFIKRNNAEPEPGKPTPRQQSAPSGKKPTLREMQIAAAAD